MNMCFEMDHYLRISLIPSCKQSAYVQLSLFEIDTYRFRGAHCYLMPVRRNSSVQTESYHSQLQSTRRPLGTLTGDGVVSNEERQTLVGK